jgi:hypothetical protein
MSLKEFQKAYNDSNTSKLKKYIKGPSVVPVEKFLKYLTTSFSTNSKVFKILLQILIAQYNLNEVISHIIASNSIDLLEAIFKYDDCLDINMELILQTFMFGRLSIAKMIYQYNNKDVDEYSVVLRLLNNFEFEYDDEDNSIDSFVLSLHDGDYKRASEIVGYITPNFWNDFAIRYCVEFYKSDMTELIRKLLGHNSVDPGVESNMLLKSAVKNKHYMLVNELLKHPLVQPDCVNIGFIKMMICNNGFSVAERLMRSGDKTMLLLFKQPCIIEDMLEAHNSITYLAVKLGIIDENELIGAHLEDEKRIKKNLREFQMEPEYCLKPYHLNLDPMDKFVFALKENDVEQLKTIENFPISIGPFLLMRALEFTQPNDVHRYIWNHIFKQYDQTELLVQRFIVYAQHDKLELLTKELIEDMFYQFQADPKFDAEVVYDICDCDIIRKIMRELIKETSSKSEYKKFCKKFGEYD